MSLKVMCKECDHPLHLNGRCWTCLTTYKKPQCFKHLREVRDFEETQARRIEELINENFLTYGGKDSTVPNNHYAMTDKLQAVIDHEHEHEREHD